MRFGWAKIRNVRLLRDESLTFHPRLNVIVGDNAAGKTTVLECLQILGRGDSGRGSAGGLVSHGEDRWRITAGIPSTLEPAVDDQVRVVWADRSVQISINRQKAGRADLARRVPVLSITPHSHRLLEEGPGLRRRYLDWGVFHMEPSFLAAWKRMTRALAQRNAALRQKRRPSEVAVWNHDLGMAAETVTEYRSRYVEALQPVWQAELASMGLRESWTLKLHPGWKNGVSYADVLTSGTTRDLQQGFTVEGPHRAELKVLLEQRNVRPEISRGQQKLLISALIVAQGKLYGITHGESPALLVDDLAAELSETSRASLLRRLGQYPGQQFLTALDPAVFASHDADRGMFHVEQGRLTRLN